MSPSKSSAFQANRQHSSAADDVLSALGDIRVITDRNAKGVKETQGAATRLLGQAQAIAGMIDQIKG